MKRNKILQCYGQYQEEWLKLSKVKITLFSDATLMVENSQMLYQ